MIGWWLWAVALLVCPGAFLYMPLALVLSWIASSWLRREIEAKLARIRAVTVDVENMSDVCTIKESLDECEKVCIGWSPLCILLSPMLFAAAAYLHFKEL